MDYPLILFYLLGAINKSLNARPILREKTGKKRLLNNYSAVIPADNCSKIVISKM